METQRPGDPWLSGRERMPLFDALELASQQGRDVRVSSPEPGLSVSRCLCTSATGSRTKRASGKLRTSSRYAAGEKWQARSKQIGQKLGARGTGRPTRSLRAQ